MTDHGQSSSSSLEEELSIPQNATLFPSNSPTHASLLCSGSVIPISIATSLRHCGKQDNHSERGSSSSVDPRCIIVGRQATTADLRIDHGSISRKHAALYYTDDTSSSSSSSSSSLVIQDLGGKHGTYVNGTRIEKNGTKQLKNDDRIIFGNVRERVFVVKDAPTGLASAKNDLEPGVVLATNEAVNNGKNAGGSDCLSSASEELEKGGMTKASEHTEGTDHLPKDSRARREAEIAAMVASLEETPTYEKYTAPITTIQNNNDEYDGFQSSVTCTTSGPSISSSGTVQDTSNRPPQHSASQSITQKYSLPISHRTIIPPPRSSTSSKSSVITALTLDKAGSRLITGCTDTNIYMYDFGGMDSRHEHFRQVEVEEGYPIVDICYSNTGDKIIVGTGSAQPKVLDRDGHEVIQFIKGDMYVTDQARTTGHTAAITAVSWHPLERNIVLTSSIDGSARLWNLNGKTQFKKLVCSKVYRAKNAKGQRTGVTAVAFHPGGREFALGTSCGSIQIWSTTRMTTRPDAALYDVHGTARPVNSLVHNTDGTKLASRSMDDDTVKVWDTKRLSRSSNPLLICGGLPSLYEASNSAFSPNGKVICAGTSINAKQKQQGTSELKFYAVPHDNESSSVGGNETPILELDVALGASAIRVVWHSKLNQIFVGCSNGSICVFYDPDLSTKGALLSTSKAARQKDELSLLLESRAPKGSAAVTGEILTPHALPMFRDGTTETKRKREKERLDPVKSRRPEPPAGGIKTGGQSSATVNFTQFVVKSTIRNKNIAGKDPRDELFKYSEGKTYVSQAYEGDKQVVLADKTAEEEEEDMKRKKK